jgi:hypothetical protein
MDWLLLYLFPSKMQTQKVDLNIAIGGDATGTGPYSLSTVEKLMATVALFRT